MQSRLRTVFLVVLLLSVFGVSAVGNVKPAYAAQYFTYHTYCVGVGPGCGSLAVTGVGTYTEGQTGYLNAGQQYTIIANPPSGYVFEYWAFAGATVTSWTTSPTQMTPSSGTTNNYLTARFTPYTGFDYSLSNGGSVSVTPGNSISVTITATLLSGITQSVSLAHSGEPTGTSAYFSVPTVYPTGSVQYTISTTTSAPLGTYQITITGTSSGGVVRYTYFSVTIGSAGFDFSLSASPTSVTVAQSSSATSTITVTRTAGTTTDVALNILSSINGATMTRSPTHGSPTFTSTFTITTTASAQVGTYSVRIRGDGGGVSHDLYLTVTVQSTTPTYSVTVSTNPSSGTINVGGSSYPSGTVLTLTAGSYGISASKSGYVFSSWATSGCASVIGTSSYTLVVASGSGSTGTVTAVFIPKVTLTFYTSTGTGSLTVTGVGTYTNGQSAQFSPGSYTLSPNVPVGGYTFGSFSPSGAVNMASEYVMNVLSGAGTTGSITATWIPPAPTFTVTFYTSTHSGSITVDGVTYTSGLSASIAQGSHAISATPPTGSSLIDWTTTGSITAYGGVMSVSGTGTLTANFAAVDFPISIITNPSDIGTVTITSKGSYVNGGTASLGTGEWTVTANSGSSSYAFSSWVFAGGANLVSPYTLTSNPTHVLVASTGGITAKFTLVSTSYTVTFYTSTGGGTISVVGGGTYIHGASGLFLAGDYTLSPSPPSGYTFGSFSAAGSVTMASTYVMHVTGAGSVTATWISVTPPPIPTSQLDRVGIATYIPNDLSNGGFESGSLSPWYIAGPPAQVEVSSAQVHSGSYSVSMIAPSDGITGIQQVPTSPIQLPIAVEAYFFNAQYPTPCYHPFTQWSVYDGVGHTVENGFGPFGEVFFYTSSSNGMANYARQPINQWIKFKLVLTNQNSISFYVNDQLKATRTNAILTQIVGIQLFNSCSAQTYIDDVKIYNPQGEQYVLTTHARDSELSFIGTYREYDSAWTSWSAINFGMTLVASDFSPSVTVSENYVYLAFSDVNGTKYVTMSPIPNSWPPIYQWVAPTQLPGGATVAGMTIMYSESDGKIWLTYVDSAGKVNRGYFNDGHPELFSGWTTLSGITTSSGANFGRIDASGCLTIVASASDYNVYEWSCDSASWRKVTSGLSTNATAALWVEPTIYPAEVVWNMFVSPLSPATLYYGSTTVTIGAFPSAPIQSFNALCYSSITGIGSTTSSSGDYRLTIVTSSYEIYIGKETSQTVTDWANACGSGQPLQYWIKIPDNVPGVGYMSPTGSNSRSWRNPGYGASWYGWVFQNRADLGQANFNYVSEDIVVPKISSVTQTPDFIMCTGMQCMFAVWAGVANSTTGPGFTLVQAGLNMIVTQAYCDSSYTTVCDTPEYYMWSQIWEGGELVAADESTEPVQVGDTIRVDVYKDENGIWHANATDVTQGFAVETHAPISFDSTYAAFVGERPVLSSTVSITGGEVIVSLPAIMIPSFNDVIMDRQQARSGSQWYSSYELYTSGSFTHTLSDLKDPQGYYYVYVYPPQDTGDGSTFHMAAPAIVESTYPLGQTVKSPVELDWTSTTETSRYIIAIVDYTAGNQEVGKFIVDNPPNSDSLQVINSIEIPSTITLTNGHVYIWYVWAIPSTGPIYTDAELIAHSIPSSSATGSFIFSGASSPPPSAPIKMTPINNAHVTKHFTFTWQAVPGADKYRVVLVDTQPSSVGSVCAYETTMTSLDSTTFYNIVRSDATFPHQFHWMVLAHNANGWTTVPQPYWTFTIDSAS